MYKMIIFDLDGTLLNTLMDLSNAVNYALKKNNIPVISEDAIRHFIGNGIKNLCSKASNGKKEEAVFNDFKEYYSIHNQDLTIPYEGINISLEYLKEKYILGVLSNKKDELTKRLINNYFPNVFSFAYGERENVKRKPNSEAMELIKKEYNLQSSDILYIGDSEIDGEFAKNSGVDYAICTWGYRTREELEKQIDSGFLIDNPLDLKIFL